MPKEISDTERKHRPLSIKRMSLLYPSRVSGSWLLVLALVPKGKGILSPQEKSYPWRKAQKIPHTKGDAYVCLWPLMLEESQAVEGSLRTPKKCQTPLLRVLCCVPLRKKGGVVLYRVSHTPEKGLDILGSLKHLRCQTCVSEKNKSHATEHRPRSLGES